MAIKRSQTTQLTDAQRAALATAAQRSDASIVRPARLKGKAAQKLAQALIDRGLAREIRAKGEQPVWREDQDSGQRFALVLTKAGQALAAEQGDGGQQKPGITSGPTSTPPASSPTVPRQGSKLAAVIALLGREKGTSVSEVMAATGWLPHTTRAALTGLRKRGYALTREATEVGPVYRIGAGPAATA